MYAKEKSFSLQFGRKQVTEGNNGDCLVARMKNETCGGEKARALFFSVGSHFSNNLKSPP